MDRVAALICDDGVRARFRRALDSAFQMEFFRRGSELLAAARRRPAHAVITELRDERGACMSATVRLLRTGLPTTPILAYCAFSTTLSRDLLPMVRAGITGILLRGCDDVRGMLRTVLADAEKEWVSATVSRAIAPLVSPEAQRVIQYCIEHARSAPTVCEIATALGVHRRTLVNWMGHGGLLEPRAVVAWCRLLLAARLLDEPARSVECVALDLGFGSATELRNMLRRYTGLRAADVRARGGFRLVLDLFLLELSGGAWGERTPAIGAALRSPSGAHVESPIAHRRTVLAEDATYSDGSRGDR